MNIFSYKSVMARILSDKSSINIHPYTCTYAIQSSDIARICIEWFPVVVDPGFWRGLLLNVGRGYGEVVYATIFWGRALNAKQLFLFC